MRLRRVGIGAAVLALTLGAAACGSSSKTADSSNSSSTSSSSSSSVESSSSSAPDSSAMGSSGMGSSAMSSSAVDSASSGSSAGGDTSGSSGATDATAVTVPAGGKSIKSIKIGFAQRTANAPYYVAMQKKAEELASTAGFSLLFQSANGDPVTQIDQVNTLISQGVDVLIVNAVSAGTEKPQMTAAAGKKPLLFIDTSIPDVGFTTVQSDNEKIGHDSGMLMAKRIGTGKSVKVAILNGGPTDVDVGPARRNGFLSGLKDGGVTADIVGDTEADYAQDKAVQATEDMLTANPGIDVIFGYNDAMALGALSVLKTKNNTHALVAGVDGQKEALAAISSGGCTGQYVSTGLNSPSLATVAAVQAAIDVATGTKKTTDFAKTSYTTAARINCDNVAKYYDPKSVF